jgi:hypothetical protein
LEANAALRSIVRRETGETYQEFLTQLAKTSGIETPTREDLARLDRMRKKKGSNDDWTHPHDPDAKIMDRFGRGVAWPTLSTQSTSPPEKSDECSGEDNSQHDAAHDTRGRHQRFSDRAHLSS